MCDALQIQTTARLKTICHRSLLSIVLSILLFTILLSNTSGCQNIKSDNDAFHIAMIVPTSIPTGESHIHGAQLYLDEINENGGINGRKIVLDVYDDEGKAKTAIAKAEKIAADTKTLAVIGHISSHISRSAGPTYKKYELPVITPSSTDDRVTIDNEWYFRTVFNNSSQGRFLAYYVKHILKCTSVCVIREDTEHSSGIAEVFKDSAAKERLEIRFDHAFNVKDPNLDDLLASLANEMGRIKEDSAIFIGAHAVEGAKLVRLLKDAGTPNPILGPTAFATKEFQDQFKNLPKEKSEPGYYTNNLLIGVPLIFDTANREAQNLIDAHQEKYNSKPDWQAAYAYDTAKVLVSAIRETEVTGRPNTIKSDRKKIREYLSKLTNVENAIEGTTGLNYFDANGDCPKPVTFGVYRNNNIISSLTQLRPVSDMKLIKNIDEAIRFERVLPFGDTYMYRTNVAYSGIEIGSIDKVDVKNSSCLISFYIWFRYHGDFNAEDILFLNAIDPIDLTAAKSEISSSQEEKLIDFLQPSGASQASTMTGTKSGEEASPAKVVLIEQDHGDGMHYRLYHIVAKFRILSAPYRISMIESYLLGFRFRHRHLSRNNLIYVADVIGMGLTKENSFLNKLKNDSILDARSGWELKKVFFFQNTAERNSRGALRYLDMGDKSIKYSQFNFSLLAREAAFSLRRKISAPYAAPVCYVFLAALVVLIILYVHPTFSNKKVLLLLQILSAFLFLLTAEVIVLKLMLETEFKPGIAILVFDILWWIVPTFYIIISMQAFIWGPIEKQTGRPLPGVIRRLVAYMILFVAGYGIVVYVFDINITRLMATSGAVAMVFGIIIKGNISNFFAGISINQGYAVRMGQWVKISGFEEGKVEEITKLVTRIRTREGIVLSIPNSIVIASDIKNYGDPEDIYWADFTLETVPEPPPDQVMAHLFDAVLKTEGVLDDPQPDILFEGQGDSSAIYTVRFAARDYENKPQITTKAWNSIWNCLSVAGIKLATPRRNYHFMSEQTETACSNNKKQQRQNDINGPS